MYKGRLYKLLCMVCMYTILMNSNAQTPLYSDIRFKKYNAEHGLTSGACGNIYRDMYGLLWISNYYGVSIFNGSHFFNLPMYTADNNFNLSQKPHYFLQMDSVTMLISAPTGIYQYNYNNHTVSRNAKQPIPISKDRVELLGRSASGDKVYAKTAHKIYIINRSFYPNDTIHCIDEKPGVFVKNIGTQSEHFYLTATNHLLRINIAQRKTDTVLILPGETKGLVINAESKNEYLLCTDETIYRIEKKTLRLISAVEIPESYTQNAPPIMGATALDKHGNYWMSADEKLFIYSPIENSFTDVTASKAESNVVDIKINDEEIVLSTSASTGILVSDRTSLLIKNYNRLPRAHGTVSAMLFKNNKLIVDGFGGSINVIDPARSDDSVEYFPLKQLSTLFVQFEHLDEDHIWYVSWGKFKLGIINTKSFTSLHLPLPIDSLAQAHQESFKVLVPTKESAPLIKKIQDGLFYYSLHNKLYKVEGSIKTGFKFQFIDSVGNQQYITTIDRLTSGDFMFGTSGLQTYSLQNNRLERKIISVNVNVPVRNILEDAQKKKYLLTTNGIYIYDSLLRPKNHMTSENHQVPGNIIYSGFIDDRNLLWAATNAGAIVYDCSKRNVFALSSLKAISNIEFNTRSIAVDDQQHVYFGGTKGITAINTSLFANKKRDFQLCLFSVKNQDSLLHNSLLPGSIVEEKAFPYNKNSFSFSVHVISTLRSEPLEMRYFMEGFDSVWRTAANSSIEFMSLKPGNYRFIMRGKYPDSDTVRQVSYSFRINPPFWKQLWFRLLSSVFMGLLIYLLVNYWHRKKTELERLDTARQLTLKNERMRISQELHDDMGSGLTAIRLLCKSAITRPDSPRIPSILTDISTVTGELIEQMSEIIWVLSHSDDTLNGLMVYLRSYMTNYLKRVELPIKLEFKNSIKKDFNISSTQRRNILLVAKESFHNAVKYSGADTFTVECTHTNSNTLHIVISDNGKGIDENSVPKGTGNGLQNMKKRIVSINGTLNIENNNGTNLIINIPLKEATTQLV